MHNGIIRIQSDRLRATSDILPASMTGHLFGAKVVYRYGALYIRIVHKLNVIGCRRDGRLLRHRRHRNHGIGGGCGGCCRFAAIGYDCCGLLLGLCFVQGNRVDGVNGCALDEAHGFFANVDQTLERSRRFDALRRRIRKLHVRTLLFINFYVCPIVLFSFCACILNNFIQFLLSK